MRTPRCPQGERQRAERRQTDDDERGVHRRSPSASLSATALAGSNT